MRIALRSNRYRKRSHAVAMLPRLSALALCLASVLLLAACGGGGGGGSGAVNVRAMPPPPPPTPPPPPPPPPPAFDPAKPPDFNATGNVQITLVGGGARAGSMSARRGR